MEQWDLYDCQRHLTGKMHPRGEKIPDGYYHLVVHVWIVNQKGEYLISQGSASRPAFPLMLETAGGSVLAGEESKSGALREVWEELGLKLEPEQGRLLFSEVGRVIHGEASHDILDVWLWPYDGSTHLEDATTDEVEQAIWMRPEEIQALLQRGEMVDTLTYFSSRVFNKNL